MTDADVKELRRLAATLDPGDDPAYVLLHRVADRLEEKKDEPMAVKFDYGHTLNNGGRVEYYRVNSWTMEVVYDADGIIDLDSDADLQYSKRAARAWQAWADFIENGGLESG